MAAQPEYRKFEQPPAPKWRRILEPEEFFVEDGDWRMGMYHYGEMWGYWCKAGVLLKGHETCTCYRAQSVQEVQLFCVHPPNYKFPLHYQVMTQMIDHVSDGTLFGFNDYSVGALVRRPTYASCGYMEKRLQRFMRSSSQYEWWEPRWGPFYW